VPAVAARPGLIVVDASLGLVASNDEAIQILTFPHRREKIHDLTAWLANKVRSTLVNRRSPNPNSFVSEFQSAKRIYLCRCLQLSLSETALAANGPRLVLMLERKSNGAIAMAEISKRFGLTAREQQAVQLLVEGLTSKEIAVRMNISPNTVKAFVHMVMVKMGVSTRSGIIGKIVGAEISNSNHSRGANVGIH
jgi:DNA-binding CsgD family transcriptional regulator